MKQAAQTIESPCNDVCRVDAASGLCLGCWRTLDEIAAWSAMADARKIALLAELDVRRAGAQAAAAREGEGRQP